MVVCKRPVPTKKFENYVRTIKFMEQSRCNPYLYRKMDLLRQKLHDEILIFAGTTRNDKMFAFEFSKLVEDMI